MSDPHRFPDYVDGIERMIDVPDAEFARGYMYREYGGVRPFLSESTWTVLELDPPVRQLHRGDDGAMTIDIYVNLERIASGTRLTHRLELHPRWYMVPLSAIGWPLFMKKRTHASMEQTNQNVKRLVEAEVARGDAHAAAS